MAKIVVGNAESKSQMQCVYMSSVKVRVFTNSNVTVGEVRMGRLKPKKTKTKARSFSQLESVMSCCECVNDGPLSAASKKRYNNNIFCNHLIEFT